MPSYQNINKAFKKVEFKGLALDAYLTNKLPGVRKIAEESFTYGYKKVKPDGTLTGKFATLMMLGSNPTLVLHIGKAEEGNGLIMQEELDRVLGHSHERSTAQIEKKSHEVFIKLDWVNDIDQITDFVDEVYGVRK